eukprot:CAMPEP_0171306282 /NCGR_PEP_ID=MMETSP0816-20121228/16274_1 /TAXON_ID=420281 /ORGANISM="Proboscia inermis, Strain CCAP1064/1" /LENGTH=77 /DNA_ID=CAMNT_0011787757 /DNA_START=276 /DNA_END=506 /DNA_ORIENTATION=+
MAFAIPGSDEEIEAREFSRGSTRALQGIPQMATCISGEMKRRQNVTNFFIASKLVAKAAHVKHVLEEEHNKKKKENW